jgi:hypothetical protein
VPRALAAQVVRQATSDEANIVVHPVFLNRAWITLPPIRAIASAIERQIPGGRIAPSIGYFPTFFHSLFPFILELGPRKGRAVDGVDTICEREWW